MPLTDRFERALQYATELHASQTRKGTSVPYIGDLRSLTGIALECGADEDEAIGARLHDAVVEGCTDTAYLARRRALEPLLRRHQFAVDSTSPGIPDLFLCRVESDGRVTGARFVEVKSWDERISPSQIRELRFFRSMGVKAGVVRLLRPSRPDEGASAVA